MTDSSTPRKARFEVGDHVRAVGPTARRRQDNRGRVSAIVSSEKNAVYRYRVTFLDGNSDVFFGFELEPADS